MTEPAVLRIGVDVGGTKIEAIALDDRGRELTRRRVPTPRDDYEATIRIVVDLVQAIEAELNTTGTVGVGIPGVVSPDTGLVKNANSVWLIGHPLDKDLEKALERSVRVANDANCFALSEAVDGAAAGAEVVFGVILGTGVGGGVVIGRKAVVGANAIGGEWGHNALPWPRDDERPGPDCYCGLRGCIETFLSGPALARQYREVVGTTAEGPEILAKASAGDAVAEDLLKRYDDRLARALASIINVVDPHVIVLGGGLSNMDRLVDNVPGLWDQYVFSDQVNTVLRSAVHGDSSGVRGAAWLWPSITE
ncbi:MAG: ROK family protein [Fidelibacterota bacterium]|nr:MAG: ROK family protein [Candidatus Neomarinimicrobiota bacterium]